MRAVARRNSVGRASPAAPASPNARVVGTPWPRLIAATPSWRRRSACSTPPGRFAYTRPIDAHQTQFGPEEIDIDRLVLIATGAHLRSEVGDRPLAYALREEILARLESRFPDGSPVDVVVCSDVWRLNDDSLKSVPTVSIGGPGVNALTAYLGDKLASVFVIDDRLIVQMDLDFDDLIACCWGMDHDLTIQAVDAFVERYLDDYLDAVIRRVQEEV